MMHVAQAGEGKGRVVLQLGSGAASPVAIEAAVWLARAFQSEIESLFVESEQLVAMAGHPFAREISWSGKASHELTPASVERHFRFASAEFHEQIATRARAADVPCRARVVRGDPVDALAAACAERGPWNVVALAEAFGAGDQPSLKRLLDTVAGTTGLLLVGPQARRTSGAIVLALEEPDGLAAMLAAAERLSAVDNTRMVVCLLAADAADLAILEGQARLMLADRFKNGPQDGSQDRSQDRSQIEIVPAQVLHGSVAAVAETLRRLAPGLVIGRFGGLLIPADADVRTLADSLECPLLLLR